MPVPRVTALAPAALAPPLGLYSHGVRVDAGGALVLTSGQLALDAEGRTPEGARAQAALILSNIDAILASGGLARADVLRLNAYVTRREDMAPYMAARDAWLEAVPVKPASTLVIVTGFTRPEFLVEIEALALRPGPLSARGPS